MKARVRPALPHAEALERRQMLSAGATVTAQIENRTLIVEGTDGDDDITVFGDGPISVYDQRGSLAEFNRADVDQILVRGYGGDDRLYLSYTRETPATLDGGDGKDNFQVESARASLIGGNGDDWFFWDLGGNLDGYDGGPGTDMLNASEATDVNGQVFLIDLRKYPTVENAILNSGTIIGNDLNNVLRLENSGTLLGGAGNDTLNDGNSGPNLLDGGSGNDTITGAEYNSDTLLGGSGNDCITGTGGPDSIDGGDGNDKISAATGNDTVNGGGGNDWISGDENNDLLRGGDGNDTLLGGDQDDILDGGKGADLMKGGAGFDTADYSSRTRNLVIGIGTLADDGEKDEHDNVWNDIEKVIGGSGNDLLRGNGFANVLLGLAGNDTLDGGGGNDALFGGSGNDQLTGGAGNDYMEGQAGNDTLLSRDHQRDTVGGGPGNDRAQVDNSAIVKDLSSEIETLLP